MILEYAQLLSTAHRVLDGTETNGKTKTGKNAKRWSLSDDRDAVLYSATHINHPSAKWTRHSLENYQFLFRLWIELNREYNYRYGKIHASMRLAKQLQFAPSNISTTEKFSAPWRAMPEEFKVDDTVESYRNYYRGAKQNMFSWKKRETPSWITK